jgi:hypothetical protein
MSTSSDFLTRTGSASSVTITVHSIKTLAKRCSLRLPRWCTSLLSSVLTIGALFLLLSNLLRSQWANDRRQKSRFWGCGSHPLFIASFIASSHPTDAAFPHFTALKGLLRY